MNKRDIVLINIPFTDLSDKKLRPALILANVQDDLLCCFISSILESETKNDVILKKDKTNNLKVDSVIKCGKLFTLHSSLVEWKIGVINKKIYDQVAEKLMQLIG